MSNEQEIERRRADLEVLKRYDSEDFCTVKWVVENIEKEISKLEAAAADPWREAKEATSRFRAFPNHRSEVVVGEYVLYLESENARLEKRVEEFRHGLACMVSTYGKINERSEIAVKHARKLIECEGEEIDVSFDVKDVADMQPPFEGPIVGIEPVLDPARVLATAAEVAVEMSLHGIAIDLRYYARDAKPYRLKGTDK